MENEPKMQYIVIVRRSSAIRHALLAKAVVVALPTLGTDGPSLTTAFVMTVFVTIKATQWVWYVY